MTTHTINADDYRTSMQRAALDYLKRHKDQHLAESDLLFNACVHHLVNALVVPVFLSQSLVQRAWDDLFPEPTPNSVWFGVDMAAGEAPCPVSDRLTGQHPKHP